MKTKKYFKTKSYDVDMGFYSVCLTVKAKTAAEAKRKAFERVKKMAYSKVVCPDTTFAEKAD